MLHPKLSRMHSLSMLKNIGFLEMTVSWLYIFHGLTLCDYSDSYLTGNYSEPGHQNSGFRGFMGSNSSGSGVLTDHGE
jgi:hypothetical protein